MADPRDPQFNNPPGRHPPPAHALPSTGAARPADDAIDRRSGPLYPGLPTGTGLGKYRILERIGKVRRAVLYRARDAMLDRLVVVKQMAPELIDDPIACGHFKREAQFLARLPKNLDYVVGIHELIEDELGLFIVEEHVDGRRLESLIAKRQATPKVAIDVLKSIALALRTMHAHQLVHRDLHPGHIVVTRDGTAKITDLSAAAHESDTSPFNDLNAKYAAPELLLNMDYDDRVDIYALGMITLEMCVGRRTLHTYFSDLTADPRTANERWTEWHTDYGRPLPEAITLNHLVPPMLSTIIQRMTSKSLDKRYATTHELLNDLIAFFEEQRAAATKRWTSPPRPARLPEPRTDDPFDLPRVPPASTADGGRTAIPPSSSPQTPQPAEVPGRFALPYSTSTQKVAPITERLRPSERVDARRADPSARSRATSPPISRPPGATLLRRKAVMAPPRPMRVREVPAPELVEKSFRERHPRLLAQVAAAALFLALVIGGGAAAWYYTAGPGVAHPIEELMPQARRAYDAGRLDEALAMFQRAAQFDEVPTPFLHLHNQAEVFVTLIRAQQALSRDDFATAQAWLGEAESKGASTVDVQAVQQRLWSRKDAYRLAQEGEAAIEEGQIAIAEDIAREFEEKASQAGLDPLRLREKLRATQEDEIFKKALDSITAALGQSDFKTARQRLREVEEIRGANHPQVRAARKRIDDHERRNEWIARGDAALKAGAFADAAQAYEEGIRLVPSRGLEIKIRQTRALLLLQEALVSLEEGNLITAERKLKNSMWKYPTPQAEAKLEKLAAQFEAARIERRADQEARLGRATEALRLYKEAMPGLPAVRQAIVTDKIKTMQREALIQAGDEAMAARKWSEAISAFEQANAMQYDPELSRKIIRVRNLASADGK